MSGALSGEGIRSVFAAIRATPMPLNQTLGSDVVALRPFVTISRQGGAGGHSIGQHLVERLNELQPGAEPWTLWDRQLVEKVAQDHHIAQDLVETLEQHQRTWMEDFLAGLSMMSDPNDARIYRGVATTIRALATRGHAVIVGRGGVYITRNMIGGVHLRLVAPFSYRAQFMARQLGIDLESAKEHVRQLDRQRKAFYYRYWPKEVLDSEAFTLTFNTATVSEDRVVESVIPLVLQNARVVAPAQTSEASSIGA